MKNTCNTCGKVLDDKDSTYCRECWNKLRNEEHIKNLESIIICKVCGKEYQNKGDHVHNKVCPSCKANYRRFRVKVELINYKGGKCEICGYDKYLGSLIFHHLVREDKVFELGGNHCRKLSDLKQEADKCILICANCHAELHKKKLPEPNAPLVPYVCRFCGNKYENKKGRNKFACPSCYTAFLREKNKKECLKRIGDTCSVCGNNNPNMLSFHHIEKDEKRFTISGKGGRNVNSLKFELDKCKVFCMNCHQELHAKESPWYHFYLMEKQTPGSTESNYYELSGTKRERPIEKTCPICGKEFMANKNAKYCSSECARISYRKVPRPSKQDLLKLLETNSFCAVGRMFGVSDNAIRKWLRSKDE